MIDMILNSKIMAVLAILIALVMLVHVLIAPSLGVLTVTILAMSYAGLVGVPALMRKKE